MSCGAGMVGRDEGGEYTVNYWGVVLVGRRRGESQLMPRRLPAYPLARLTSSAGVDKPVSPWRQKATRLL